VIERIVIENFKSFKKVDLKLGRLNLFIGTNASGKSNFFDALRVLQGIGNGFTIHEILDGKPKSATSEVWDGIRGGSTRVCFEGTAGTAPEAGGEIAMQVSGKLHAKQTQRWEYSIRFSPLDGRVTQERLVVGSEIYDSEPVHNLATDPGLEVRYYGGKRGRQPHLKFEKTRPVLTQFARGNNGKWTKGHAEEAAAVAGALANMQRIDPAPALLRAYSQAHTIQRMGEHGENFAALIRTICADPKSKEAFLTWLKELRPAEVDDVDTLRGALGEPLFMLKEGGKEFPATILSDGTLRFAAITAAFFQPDMPAVLTVEELENGIHASRLRLLVELLRNRAAGGATQVIATTHSPIILAWLKPEEHVTTFYCKRDEKTGESTVCPLTEIPRFKEIIQKQPISDLFAEGWMEAAL
jgi:predicted ATPase